MRLFFKKKTIPKIEFCTNNLNRFYDDEAFDQLEKFVEENHLKVREMECLSYCDECARSPYALLNNEFIRAETSDELMEKIKKRL